MGTSGDRTHDDGAGDTDNVIRFPKEWFGSKDELIPFGPSAERISAERAARAARATGPAASSGPQPPSPSEATPLARNHGSAGQDAATVSHGAGQSQEPSLRLASVPDPPEGGRGDDLDDLATALDPNSFWGGQSGALQQPMGVVRGDVAYPDDAVLDERSDLAAPARRPRRRVAVHLRGPELGRLADRLSPMPRLRGGVPQFRSVPRGVLLRGAAVFLVVGCVAIAAVGTLDSTGPSRRTAAVSSLRHVLATARPQTNSSPLLSAREAETVAAYRRYREQVLRSAELRRHTAQKLKDSAHPTPAHGKSHGAAPGHTENVSTAVGSGAMSSVAQPSAVGSDGASAGTSSSADSSSEQTNVDLTTSRSSSLPSSSSGSSGGLSSSDFGGVYGPDCNPKCRP